MNKRLCKKYSIVSKVLYHCKITKCIFDCFYLFWCRMFPRLFQFFYRIRSIIHRQSQISLYLCDICGMYLEAVFRFYVLLNHFVGHFFFGLVRFGSFSNTIYRNLALALSKLHINVDITVGFFVGQKNYRLDVICIDEATQLKEEWLRQFAACLRGVNEFPKRMYYTCNPGGPGHGYIKRLFIDRRYRAGERAEEYAFIPARVTDNQALLRAQPDYLRQLEALPLRLRQAWLEGKWDVFQGQFFQEFVDDPAHYRDRRFTHVIEPFDIPREWSIWRSYDFGYAKPFSCGWWAVDHDGCVYRILELYGCTGEPDEGVRWTPEKQFAEIRRIEDTHPWLKGRDILGVADPAIWDSSRGESIYETALKHRIFFVKGDNRRIPGWMQMHYRMAFDEEGYPQLYVFTGCRAFRRTVPGLLFSETEPEDLDTRMEDHVADESRYLCMARPIPPRRVETALPVQDDPLNMLVRR